MIHNEGPDLTGGNAVRNLQRMKRVSATVMRWALGLALLGAFVAVLAAGGNAETSDGGASGGNADTAAGNAELTRLPIQGYATVPLEQSLTPEAELASFPVEHSDAEWRQKLSDMQFAVLRQFGTERAYSGDLWDEKRDGVFFSRASGEPLFSSEHKYDSGTGWPSFWQPLDPDNIIYRVDDSLFQRRIEVGDSESGSHLGHAFPDGPAPTGRRYCLNSAALLFVADDEPLPPLVRQWAERSGEPVPLSNGEPRS